jgi:hypothetical protein
MRNHASPYDHSVAGILASLTHGILRDANERAPEVGENVNAPGDASTPRGSWVTRLDAWFWERGMKRREAYLAQSADIFELERRMRGLERGGN